MTTMSSCYHQVSNDTASYLLRENWQRKVISVGYVIFLVEGLTKVPRLLDTSAIGRDLGNDKPTCYHQYLLRPCDAST